MISVCMLGGAGGSSVGVAGYYLTPDRACGVAYYTEHDQIPGRWVAEGCHDRAVQQALGYLHGTPGARPQALAQHVLSRRSRRQHTEAMGDAAAAGPGRSCPIAYRYRPEDLAAPAPCAATTLFVVGGLYGNVTALEAVLERAAREDTATLVVFNGDFHYLDADDEAFRAVATGVGRHRATRGNVESELASDSAEAGCGCGYPPYVDDGTVERSNEVMAELRRTAAGLPELVAPLAQLPRYLSVDVGGHRVGIVHGDAESLAGWRLALEALEPADPDVRERTCFDGTPTTAEDLADWFRRTQVRVLACTHTGLPYAQDLDMDGQRHLVINNGSAGLPSFAGRRHGVLTRLSADPTPPADSLYGTDLSGLRADALPVNYDTARWEAQFLAAWPAGTPGHTSYFGRVSQSTPLRLEQAARGTVALTQVAAGRWREGTGRRR